MTTTLDYELAIRLVECLAAVGVIISSAEFLSNREIFDDTNFMGWRVAQLHHPILRNEPLGKFLTLVNKNTLVHLLIVARILAAVALFFASYQQHLLRFIFDATIAFSLIDIMSTSLWGNQNIAKMLVTRKWLALLITYSVITFELMFPLVLVVPPRIALLFLSVGALFHLANAFAMGLNCFLWAFVATYPAVLYTSGSISQYLSLHISSNL